MHCEHKSAFVGLVHVIIQLVVALEVVTRLNNLLDYLLPDKHITLTNMSCVTNTI